MTLPTPLALATALIRAPSVTPSDHGCQSLLIRHLETMGFAIHPLRFGSVENFYARLGTGGTHLCFAGHTDVVAAGDPDRWRTPPFAAALQDGVLTGRGACDMKGALAAIVAAVARFLAGRPRFASQHSLSFLITGDEEGMATDGTVRVLAWLAERGERFDACLVGEPTSQERLGDCIKNGRRGSLNGEITLFGRRGHVAYPHLAENPIHGAMVLLDRLARLKFDAGNDHFPATAIQFTNINAGDGSTNVIPGRLTAGFNIRFSPESTPEGMEKRIRAVLDAGEVSRYALKTTPSGLPFLTTGGRYWMPLLIPFVKPWLSPQSFPPAAVLPTPASSPGFARKR